LAITLTTAERCYLQFMFALLNRVIARVPDYLQDMTSVVSGCLLDVWKMDDGNQNLQTLADIHARAIGAFGNHVRRSQGELLQSFVQQDAALYGSDGGELTPEAYQALVFHEAFFDFHALSLALLLRGTFDGTDLRLLHDLFLQTEEQRSAFQQAVREQCAAMNLAPSVMTDVLLTANDPPQATNAQKIAIITCVNDEATYEEARACLASMELPAGFSLEFLPVRGASSMCAGYNEGMRSTDAKYKMYVHQDMMLEKTDLLMTLLPYFEQHPDVGLIGLAGARRWQKDIIWWEDLSRYVCFRQTGGDIEGELPVVAGELDGPWADMAMLDGAFLMTQVDVPWREDLFHGWHFYDISACAEFRRAGYRVAAPRQETPWFTHRTGDKLIDMQYHYWRNVFLHEYGEDVATWRNSSI